jgi:Fe-S oxidoreductase
MPNLMPNDVVDDVRSVLREANRGKGPTPNFLTSYQILDRLPEAIRDRLIRERTLGGRGAGVSYSAASVVSDAAEMLRTEGIEIVYLDSAGISMSVAGQAVQPGAAVCGAFRLPA